MKFTKNIKEFPITNRELKMHYVTALGEMIAKKGVDKNKLNKLI